MVENLTSKTRKNGKRPARGMLKHTEKKPLNALKPTLHDTPTGWPHTTANLAALLKGSIVYSNTDTTAELIEQITISDTPSQTVSLAVNFATI